MQTDAAKIEALQATVDELEQKLITTKSAKQIALAAKDKAISELKTAYKALANALINTVKW